jgi:hypothetical protein
MAIQHGSARLPWALLLAVLAWLAQPKYSLAHDIPAQHTVLVQAEDTRITILVTWVASNRASETLSARALWSRHSASARTSLQTMVTKRVLRPLVFYLDGKPIKHTSLKTKISTDPGRSGRIAAAILISIDLDPKAHRLDVHSANDEPLRLKWLSKGATRVTSPSPPNRWQDKWHPLTLHWTSR